MKRNIVRVLCLLCALAMLGACAEQATPEEMGFRVEFPARAAYDTYKTMATSNGVELMLDPGRMDIMLKGKDFTWHSYMFTQKELKANSTERDNYSIYRIDGALIGGSQFTLDSYTDCINRGQYEVTQTKKGFTVHFVTGKLAVSRAVPEVMGKEEFEKYLDEISQTKSKRISTKVKLSYSLYTLEGNADKVADYPQLNQFPDGLYCIKTGLTDKEKDELEVYFKEVGLTVDYVKEYHDKLDYVSEATTNPVVEFKMNFELDNGDLVVSLPSDTIRVDTNRYVINSIRVMESLCALAKTGETIQMEAGKAAELGLVEAKPEEEAEEGESSDEKSEEKTEEKTEEKSEEKTEEKTEEKKDDKKDDKKEEEPAVEYVNVSTGEVARFMFYPDGCGVVADTTASNGIIGEGTLTGMVYNTVYDKIGGYAVNPVYGSENISVPVFGLAKTTCSVIGIVESGAELSRITVNYNSAVLSAYSAFVLETYDGDNVDEMVAMSEKFTDHEQYPDNHFLYSVRYKFLPGTDVDYVDMAHTYRNYLIAKGDLQENGVSKEMQFYLETLGYVKAAEEVAFVTVQRDKPLTTYEDNIDLLTRLAKGGVKNLNLKLTGWENGGLNNYYSDGVDLSKNMGGEDGFKKLTEYVQKNGIGFYPNVNFMSVGNIGSFDGFTPRKLCARDIINQYEGLYVYIPAIRDFAGFNYVINGKNILKGMNKYLADAKDYWDTKTISADYISTILAKDYHADQEINAAEQLTELKKVMESLSKDRRVMFKDANSYAYKYADIILGLSTSSTENPSLQTVPFLQIVLHGSVDFAGAAINTFDTYEDAVLKSIEYASAVYFTMIKENLIYLKGSEYSYYYSTDDDYWVDKAIEAYKTISGAVGDCYNTTIQDHKRLADNVYLTTFSNGKSIVVNYNLYDVTLSDGTTVASKGYTVPKSAEGLSVGEAQESEPEEQPAEQPEEQPAEQPESKEKEGN